MICAMQTICGILLLISVIARCKLTETILDVTRTALMDRRGEGVPIIMEEGAKLSGKRLVYSLIDDSELKPTIFAASGDSSGELSAIVQKMTDTNLKIKKNGDIGRIGLDRKGSWEVYR